MTGRQSAPSLLDCLRHRRRISLQECDLELIRWNDRDPDAACGRCPYNPLLDVVPAEEEGKAA